MIEKQQRPVESKAECEEHVELQHIPVPKESVQEPPDPQVIERLRSCH